MRIGQLANQIYSMGFVQAFSGLINSFVCTVQQNAQTSLILEPFLVFLNSPVKGLTGLSVNMTKQ